MRFADLKHGQTLRYRTGRAGAEDVEWGPWHDGAAHVQCNRKGEAALLALPGAVEVTARDFSPHYGIFNVEGYYLAVEGMEP